VFALCSVFIQLPLSLGLALLLNSGNDRWKSFFRLVLFSPNLVGQIFVGILFGVLFTPRYGLINRFTHALTGWGLERNWLFELALSLLPLSNGRGPDNAGLTVVGYLYDVGFNNGDLGLGSAVGWVVALVIAMASALQLRLTGAGEEA